MVFARKSVEFERELIEFCEIDKQTYGIHLNSRGNLVEPRGPPSLTTLSSLSGAKRLMTMSAHSKSRRGVHVSSHLLPVSSLLFPVSCFLFPVSSFQSPVYCFQSPVSSLLFPVSCFLFPVSSFLLLPTGKITKYL